MKTGTAIIIVGMWFAVVGALFVTTNSPFQALIGIAGFLFALIATVGVLIITSET